jgi:hypothetical protein
MSKHAILPVMATVFCTLTFSAQAAPRLAGSSPAAIVDAADHPTLQTALDALPATGGLVRLPPGTFEISSPLVFSSENARLEGSGAATHIVNKNEQGQPAFILRPKDRASNKRSRIWRLHLANFRISGNPKSGDGLLAEGVNEIFLHGLWIDRNGGHGINLIDCYEDPRIADCILTYNARAGLNIVGGHDIVVNANHFEENQDGVRCVDSFNLCMSGNNLDDHLRHGVVIENTYGSVLSGNMIEECNGTAIILDRDCYGITISANVIAHHLGGGVHLLDAWGCAVSANTFTLVHSNSVYIGSQSGRNTVTGNSFCNSFKGDGDKRPAEHKDAMGRDEGTGILLEGTRDITISGNTFSGLSTPAVTAKDGCQRLLIIGNLITDVNRKSPGLKALELGDAKESLVKDNLGPSAP